MLLFPNNNSAQKKWKQNKKHQVLNIKLTQQGLKIKNSVLLTTKLSMLLIKYKHTYIFFDNFQFLKLALTEDKRTYNT